MLILTEYGSEIFLKNVVGADRNYLWFLNLYVNDYHPNIKNTVEDYVQPDFPGYEKIMVLNWRVHRDGHLLVARAEEAKWRLFHDLENKIAVYGYYVTDMYDKLLYAERFGSAPFVIQKADSSICITPSLKM
jgi:hypothetical protein